MAAGPRSPHVERARKNRLRQQWGWGIPYLAHYPIATRGLMMHAFIQHDEDGESIFVVGHQLRRGPRKTRKWRAMLVVSALLATTMLTILTATAAEAKKCKTLRLPSGERFA